MSQDGGDTDAQGVGATDVPGRRWHVLPQARDDGQARAARGLLFECSPALLGQGEGGCSGQTEGDREHREGEDLPPERHQQGHHEGGEQGGDASESCRRAVGYSSGPIAYSAPQAPRLKKLRAQPETMIIASVSARPKAVAATAEPARNTVSVQRRPITSINQAETA